MGQREGGAEGCAPSPGQSMRGATCPLRPWEKYRPPSSPRRRPFSSPRRQPFHTQERRCPRFVTGRHAVPSIPRRGTVPSVPRRHHPLRPPGRAVAPRLAGGVASPPFQGRRYTHLPRRGHRLPILSREEPRPPLSSPDGRASLPQGEATGPPAGGSRTPPWPWSRPPPSGGTAVRLLHGIGHVGGNLSHSRGTIGSCQTREMTRTEPTLD